MRDHFDIDPISQAKEFAEFLESQKSEPSAQYLEISDYDKWTRRYYWLEIYGNFIILVFPIIAAILTMYENNL